MEQHINIPTTDGFELPGILNSKQKSHKLLLFVHGFTGSMTEAHYYCAKEYFTQRWYDVFRFNLYTDGEQTRKLRDCSVKTHSQDIQIVSEYFSNYTEVCFVGHSLAGPCLAGVSVFPENIKKIVFWDPAFEMQTTGKKIFKVGDAFRYQSSGKHIEISETMREEFLQDTFLDTLEKQNFSKENMFAIYADGDRHILNKPKTDALGIASVVIEWANHWFTQEGKFEELFKNTLEFIEK